MHNVEVISVGGRSDSSSYGIPSIKSQKTEESDNLSDTERQSEGHTDSAGTTLHISVLEDNHKEEPTTTGESDSSPDTEEHKCNSEAETTLYLGQETAVPTVALEQERREKCVRFAQGEATIIESLTEVGDLQNSSTEDGTSIFSSMKVFFKKEQFSIAPGQAAVFYCGDVVLGGGIIQP